MKNGFGKATPLVFLTLGICCGLITPGCQPNESSFNAAQHYLHSCAACHGDLGDGAGIANHGLIPPATNFQDPQWQQQRTDEHLAAVIKHGGSAMGLSSNMPASPQLSDKDIQQLIHVLRAFHSDSAH